jgi:hypothetical protein
MTAPFWKTKSLREMSEAEWESLCDGCGKCCLMKFEYEDDPEVVFTRLACRLFDDQSCRCKDYENRKAVVPDCVKLTPDVVETVNWLPSTCAYRLVHEGKDLFEWHHLICGDKRRIHREAMSVRGLTVPENTVAEDDQEDYLFDWDTRKPIEF